MGQYFFAGWRLLFIVVCNAAGGRDGQVHGNVVWERCWQEGQPGAWTLLRRASTVTSR